LDDRAEAAAIRTFFGSAADTIPVTCLKGHIGNPGAGGGFIDLIASILALKEGALFPILNNRTDDPRCPIRPVRQFGEPAGKTFLKLAGQKFGQTSAVLIRGL
ncbi:MAG: beta-ketoacyl-[acyl-carrier-protein] synthase family protein, partial [Thermoguttaceae bacterium]|nr:beta-ketoacyl-[acyl-carrier-protein] synthase family protein [Thermoguttaceae bacterium]